MKKIKYIINILRAIHKSTKKSYFNNLKDIFLCKKNYKASLTDYYLFKLYKRNTFERKTYITEGINREYIAKYNSHRSRVNFKNRSEFNRTFEKVLNRDWLELDKDNYYEFENFCMNREAIIIRYSNKQKRIITKNQDLIKLFIKLTTYEGLVVESDINPCYILDRLQPDSLNIVKVVTFLGTTVMASLEIGNESKQLNFTKDSIIASINVNTGKIDYPATNHKLERLTRHPVTNKQIKGIKIPRWESVKTLCENASLEIPYIGYVEWSICVENDKCSLIGMNPTPNYYLYQIPTHLDNKVGTLPVLKEIERNLKE